MKNKKYIFKYLEAVVRDNGSKWLFHRSRHAYFYEFRNREDDRYHYLVNLKGNYIRAYRIKWGFNGEKEIIKEKTLLLKLPLMQYVEFIKQFKQLTPDLWWN